MKIIINILETLKSEYEDKMIHIKQTITPKDNFLCFGNPNDIPRLKNLLNEYELFRSEEHTV